MTILIFQNLQSDQIEQTFALSEPKYDDLYGNLNDLELIIADYHVYMNEFFNLRIKRLDQASLEDLVAEQESGKCDEKSIRTVCLAVQGNIALNNFIAAMDNFILSIEGNEENVVSLQEAESQLNQANLIIRLQQEAAIESFEMALTLYDEYKRNLKVHEEYKKLINNLEDYRNKLIKIREPSDLMPDKFINVTTAECT